MDTQTNVETRVNFESVYGTLEIVAINQREIEKAKLNTNHSVKMPSNVDFDFLDAAKFAVDNLWRYPALKEDYNIEDVIEGYKLLESKKVGVEYMSTWLPENMIRPALGSLSHMMNMINLTGENPRTSKKNFLYEMPPAFEQAATIAIGIMNQPNGGADYRKQFDMKLITEGLNLIKEGHIKLTGEYNSDKVPSRIFIGEVV